MAEPRLATRVWAAALLRRVHAEGGFGAVLRRGDDRSGQIVLIHRGVGGATTAYWRVLGPAGDYVWSQAAAGAELDPWLARQAGYDPDLWVIELDTPDLARFIDETIG